MATGLNTLNILGEAAERLDDALRVAFYSTTDDPSAYDDIPEPTCEFVYPEPTCGRGRPQVLRMRYTRARYGDMMTLYFLDVFVENDEWSWNASSDPVDPYFPGGGMTGLPLLPVPLPLDFHELLPAALLDRMRDIFGPAKKKNQAKRDDADADGDFVKVPKDQWEELNYRAVQLQQALDEISKLMK